ncbi:MAG: heme o synthase [Parachlamydiales bacterium]|nr:heme o synthase [Parachlamydiales bacterium]
MIRTYYLLTKPGIIIGNLITTVGGFALASQSSFNLPLFLALCIGLGGVIGSACVFNNYIDRESDQKMRRTKHRALASGLISGKSAVLFAATIGFIGFSTLIICTNLLAAAIAAIGFFIYVGLYSFWKHHSTYATLVGSVAGAVPPVIGYVAASGKLDIGSILLFSILFLWQMPHFYSIAMWKMEDYRSASIPVLPLAQGIPATKVQMLLYIIAFLFTLLLLPLFTPVGAAYLVVSVPLSLAWGACSLMGFTAKDDQNWARQMFRISLLIIMAFSLMISL